MLDITYFNSFFIMRCYKYQKYKKLIKIINL